MAESRLDIIIDVSSKDAIALTKAERQLRDLAKAQAALEKAEDRRAQSVRTLIRLQQELNRTNAENFTKQLEATRIQASVARTQREINAARRRALTQQAALLQSTGQLSRAERALNLAIRTTRRGTAERIAIERQLLALQRQRVAETRRANTQRVQEAFSQARVAAAIGNTAREMRILRAITRSNLATTEQRRRALIRLRQAEDRARRAAERHRRELARQGGALTAVRGAVGKLSAVFAIFTKVLASLVLIGFTLRTVFRAIGRFVVTPLAAITKNVLEATNSFRQLEAALVGVAGSLRAVRDLERDVLQASRDLPITALEALSGARGLAFIPATARTIQTPGPERVPQIENLLRVLTQLATIDPTQGIEGARFAVREALAGEFRSLRFRFEISPDVVAATIGRSLSELKTDPSLTLEALRAFTDLFVGEQAIQQFEDLLTTQANKFKGAMQEFFRLIGESGIFDRVRDLLRNLQTRITAGSRAGPGGEPPAFGRAAGLISDSLGRLLTGLLRAGGGAVQNLTGIPIDVSNDLRNLDVEALARSVATIVEGLSALALALAQNVPTIAETLRRFGVDLGPITEKGIISDLQDLLNERASVAFRRAQAQRDLANLGPIIDEGGVARESELRGIIQSTADRNRELDAEIQKLRERLRIFRPVIDVAEDTAGRVGDALDTAREVGKSLNLAGTQFTNTLRRDFPAFTPLLRSNVESISQILNLMYDPDEKGSIPERLAATNDAIMGIIDTLDDETLSTSQIVELTEEMSALLRKRNALLLGNENALLETLQGQFQATIEVVRGLPRGRRLGGALDVLEAIAQTNVPRGPGAPGRGLLFNQFQGQIDLIAERAGIEFGREQLFDPNLLKTVAVLIEEAGQQTQQLTGNVFAARDQVLALVDAFELWAIEQASAAGPEGEALWTEYLGLLADVRDKWVEAGEAAEDADLDKAAKDAEAEMRRLADTIKTNTRREINLLSLEIERLGERAERVGARAQAGLTSFLAPLGRLPQGRQSVGFFSGATAIFDEVLGGVGANLGAARGQIAAEVTEVDQKLREVQQRIIDATLRLADPSNVAPETTVQLLESLTQEAAGLQTLLNDLIGQDADLVRQTREQIQGSFSGLIQAGPGQIQQLPPDRQVTEFRRFFERLQDIPRINEQLRAAGLDEQTLAIQASDVTAVVEALMAFNDALRQTGVDATTARLETNQLTDQMIVLFEDVMVRAPENMKAAFEDAIAVLRQMKDEGTRVATDLEQIFAQTAQSVTGAFRSGFADIIVATARGATDEIEDIIKSTLESILKAITEALIEIFIIRAILNPAINSLFGLDGTSAALPTLFQAQGGVFDAGRLVPMAHGGVVGQPTIVPMQSGAALIGEAGPEGVLPLTRLPGGDLGVKSEGAQRPIQVVMNITTPDADSFRQSQHQIMRKTAQAVSTSQRRG